jgi:hypothetical protein
MEGKFFLDRHGIALSMSISELSDWHIFITLPPLFYCCLNACTTQLEQKMEQRF